MEDKDIKVGHCKLNGVRSYVRKINKISDDKIIVCFFYGTSGHNCEKMEDFKKRFKYEKI